MTTERQFREVHGIRTAYHIWETQTAHAPTVLCLHGWGASLDLMAPVAERLAPLGYRVITLDLPGFGETQEPPQAWGVPEYARFAVQFLEAFQQERVHVIGHSFGGRMSLILGAEYPDHFLKFALADSAGVPPKRDITSETRLKAYKTIRDGLQKVGLKTLSNNLREAYSQRYGSADFQNTSGVMRETIVRVLNQDLLPYAGRITHPTLLFWGTADEDTPLWQGELLEKTIPNAGLIRYEGAGHYSYLEHLSEFIHVVDYFFKND